MQLDKYSDPSLIPNFLSNNYLMIDLRKEEDAKNHPLPHFLNIPYHNLKNYISKFKKEVPIVVCCYYGHLSEYAYEDLIKLGFKVTIIKGGYAHYKHPVDLKYF